MTLKHTDSDLSAALAKGREEATGIARAVETAEMLMRDQARRAGDQATATLHGDRAQMARDIVKAIRALSPSSPGEPAGSGWQPIATAPDTTDDILVLAGGSRWIAHRVHVPSEPEPFNYRSRPGQWKLVPTHWQPLPAPPHEPTGEAE